MAERKQVNLDLGKVSATPSIQAVGGTNQAVVPSVLKDNSALRLSRSLAQFSNILGQASNINMQRGQDEAEKLSSQEINDIIEGKVPAPDGGPTGKLGFQKAFHQIAAKRWFDTTGVQKYADLENKLDAKMDEFIKSSMPIEQVKAYVQNEVNALDKEIGEYFEGNSFGSRVKNLLGSELSSRITAGATKGYEKKQLAYMNAAKEEQRLNEFSGVVLGESNESLNGYFTRMQKLYKEDGYSGDKINSIFNNTFIKGLNLAMATDPDIALGMLSQAKKVKINGQPAFSSMATRQAIAEARGKISKLQESEEEDEFTLSVINQQVTGTAGKFFEVLKGYNDRNQNPPKEGGMAYNYLLQSFKVLNREGALTDVGIKPEDLTKAIMEYPNPQDGWDKEMGKLIGIKGLDPQTRASLNITLGTISDERRKINQAPPEIYTGISLSDKRKLQEDAKIWFETNQGTAEQFMEQSEFPELEPPQGVKNEYNKSILYNKYLPEDSVLDLLLDQEIDAVREDPNLVSVFKGTDDTAPVLYPARIDADKLEAKQRIIKELKDFAKKNITESTPDKETLMQEKAKDLIKEETESLRFLATTIQVRNEEDFGDDGFDAETDPQKIKASRVERLKEFKLEEEDESPFYTEGAIPFLRDPETPATFGFNLPDNKQFKKYKSLSRKYADSVAKGKKPLTDISTRKVIDADFQEARDTGDTEALELLMKFYGYKGIDFTNPKFIQDLDETLLWWNEVSLFENRAALNKTFKTFTELMIKVDKDAELTKEDRKKLAVMADLGIYDETDESVFLQNFLDVQIELLTAD